jgi:hypothetical protein
MMTVSLLMFLLFAVLMLAIFRVESLIKQTYSTQMPWLLYVPTLVYSMHALFPSLVSL